MKPGEIVPNRHSHLPQTAPHQIPQWGPFIEGSLATFLSRKGSRNGFDQQRQSANRKGRL